MMRSAWFFVAIFLVALCFLPRTVKAQVPLVCYDYVESHLVQGVSFDPLNIAAVGHLSHSARAAAEKDDYLYAAMNRELAVIDATDASQLVRTGFVLMPEAIQDVVVEDNYAYVAVNDHELRVVDVSNPQAPVMVGACDLLGGLSFTHLAVVGDYVYAVGWIGALYVINVATPTTPVIVGYLEGPDGSSIYSADLVVAPPYLYVADGQTGIQIVDISDPTAPRRVARYYTPGDEITDLALHGNRLYVANGVKGLRILDLTSPAAPTEIGRYWPAGAVRKIDFKDDLILIQMGNAPRWYSVDVSNPTTPQPVGTVDILEGAWNILAVGDRIYDLRGYGGFGGRSGIVLIDFSVPTAPQVAGRYGPTFDIHQAAYASGYLFATSSGGDMLSVFDVRDPTAPQWLIEHPIVTSAFTVTNNILYATGAGLSLIDVSDVLAPVQLGYYHPADHANSQFQDIAVDLPYAYIAGIGYFEIVDVNNPADPKRVAHFDAPQAIRLYLTLMDDYVLLTSDTHVYVVDISTITEPTLVATVTDTGYAVDVVANGHYAYVLWMYRQQAPNHGVKILDLADPTHPVEVGFIPTLFEANTITLNAPFLYVTWHVNQFGGVRVLDISNPTLPVEIAHYSHFNGWARQLAVNGDYLYVPDLDLIVLEQDRSARGHWLYLPTVQSVTPQSPPTPPAALAHSLLEQSSTVLPLPPR